MHDTPIQRRRHLRCLRNARRAASVCIAAVLTLFPSAAQTYPNGLSSDSVNPELDSIVLSRFRQKMDSVRRAENRPTVALVLSGGGAKGAAEVGALKYLMEQDIPVDMIFGTSIGGLIGGLLSVGYTPDDCLELFRSQNWNVTLSDKVSPEYIPFSEKIRKDKFILDIPFGIEEGEMNKREWEQMEYAGRAVEERSSGIGRFLPSGYSNGFNVNNLISSLTVGYQDNMFFSELPIPFMCVATDIVTCKAKYWGSGSLRTAMRSTMSIPGLFNPVRHEGMVLVDGGTRNNFPTDLARAAGADFIVGIDLSDARPTYSQVNHIGDMVSQFITMLGTDSFEKNRKDVDLIIKPDLDGYNMLSFTEAGIDTMFIRGYQAAAAKDLEIRAFRDNIGVGINALTKTPAVDLSKRKVCICNVTFDGLTDRETKLVMRRTDIGTLMGKEEMDDIMSTLQATGCFETVTYSLLGREEPYDLVFTCRKGPVNKAGLGVRMDTDEWVAILFNLGFNVNKLAGSKLDLSLKLGTNQYLDAVYSLDIPYLPTLNVEAGISYSRGDFKIDGNLLNFGFWSHEEDIYFSKLHWTKFDFNAGIRNRFIMIPQSWITTGKAPFPTDRDELSGDYLGAFLSGTMYTFNDRYYPETGSHACLDASLDFASPGKAGFDPVLGLSADFKTVIPLGERFSILPDLHFRSFSRPGGGVSQKVSMFHHNYVGGNLQGRYFETQVPLVGLDECVVTRDNAAIVNLDFRAKAWEKVFFSGLGGAMLSSDSLLSIISKDASFIWGAGVEAGYNSLLGPIRLRVDWSSLDRKPGYYISLGFDF